MTLESDSDLLVTLFGVFDLVVFTFVILADVVVAGVFNCLHNETKPEICLLKLSNVTPCRKTSFDHWPIVLNPLKADLEPHVNVPFFT